MKKRNRASARSTIAAAIRHGELRRWFSGTAIRRAIEHALDCWDWSEDWTVPDAAEALRAECEEMEEKIRKETEEAARRAAEDAAAAAYRATATALAEAIACRIGGRAYPGETSAYVETPGVCVRISDHNCSWRSTSLYGDPDVQICIGEDAYWADYWLPVGASQDQIEEIAAAVAQLVSAIRF